MNAYQDGTHSTLQVRYPTSREECELEWYISKTTNEMITDDNTRSLCECSQRSEAAADRMRFIPPIKPLREVLSMKETKWLKPRCFICALQRLLPSETFYHTTRPLTMPGTTPPNTDQTFSYVPYSQKRGILLPKFAKIDIWKGRGVALQLDGNQSSSTSSSASRGQ
jgi:hypothetical protein